MNTNSMMKLRSKVSNIYIFLVGISVFPVLFFFIPYFSPKEIPIIVFWVILEIVSDLRPVTILKSGEITEITTALAVQLALIILSGPYKATWIIVVATLLVEIYYRKPAHKCLFNAGQYGLSVLASGLLFELLKASPKGVVLDVVKDLPAIFVAASVCFLLNMFFVSAVISLTSGNKFVPVFTENLKTDIVYYYTLTPISVAASLLYRPDFPFTLLIMIPPLYAADQALRRYYSLQKETSDTLMALADTIDKRDKYTYLHSARVAEYAKKIAQKLQLSQEKVEKIETAGRVHDLGKIAIEDTILRKHTGLTDEEYAVIKQHPELGYRLIKNLKPYEEVAKYILYHHERLDGKGYPMGISGLEIPLGARILAVADSYDAMTSDRPYRTALPQAAAVQELIKCSNFQFDPDVVAAFIKVLKEDYGYVEE